MAARSINSKVRTTIPTLGALELALTDHDDDDDETYACLPIQTVER